MTKFRITCKTLKSPTKYIYEYKAYVKKGLFWLGISLYGHRVSRGSAYKSPSRDQSLVLIDIYLEEYPKTLSTTIEYIIK